MRFELDMPGLRLQSENWWRRSHPGWLLQKQRNAEKNTVMTRWLLKRGPRLDAGERVLVTLTRRSKSTRGLDGDGLQGSFKYCRDSVAKMLGVDDGSARIEWVYRQERGDPGASIVVEIREEAAA